MFHDGVGNFFVALGRQAVHEDRVGPCLREERIVHLVGAEGALAFHGFLLLAHAGPDVGVDGVGSGSGGGGIVRNQQTRAADGGKPFGLRHNFGIGQVSLGAAEGEIHAEAQSGQHERLGHVVAVADKRKLEAVQPRDSEVLADGLHIGQGLTGMVKVAQRIDDGDARPGGEAIHRALQEYPRDQAIHPAIQVAGDIFQRLANADGAFQEHASSAHLLHGEFEGELGPQRGFFEQHADILAVQGVRVVAGRGFHFGGEVEQVEEFAVGEIEILQKVGCGRFEDLVRSKHGVHGKRLD